MDADRGHVGIDFGARSAGNTVVCVREKGLFRFHRSAKDSDGDAWLRSLIDELRPAAIYIDAPLSLPGVYTGRGHDHFFRAADRQAGGMSPMFLGGLTARAMALASASMCASPKPSLPPAKSSAPLLNGVSCSG